ncbi:MAG: carbonic anhydrase, partial [Thermodesulfobacteriota bacterium]
ILPIRFSKKLMKKTLLLCALILHASLYSAIPPDQALQILVEGNKRFATDKSLHPDRTSERRQETAANQEPFAVILGCSDSRVAPEIIFDQGIGDLFIVRVAGNVVGPLELDSIEYSALYLHSSLALVLGHENCGAVKAVLQGNTKDIEAVADLLQPAAIATEKQKGDRLENTIKMNVEMVSAQLKKSPVLSRLIAQKKFSVVGGYYNFHTGQVEILR